MDILVKNVLNENIAFERLIEQCTDGIAILSPEQKLRYISPSVKRILGYTAQEIIAIGWLDLIQKDSILSQTEIAFVLANPGVPYMKNARKMRHKDGSWRWIEGTITNMLHDPSINGIVNNFRDVTEKKEAEEHLIHANRLYAFISQINQAIVHVADETAVFKEACRIAKDVGKFKAAWIGLLNPLGKTINMVEECGIVTEDKHLFQNVIYDENGPQHRVFCTNTHFVCNDIEQELKLASWKALAALRGWGSFMVLPIKKTGKVIGTFNLYATEAHFFNPTEISLLVEATEDISFALEVFEKERIKDAMHKKLLHSELRLTQAQAIAHLGNWEYDLESDVITWSDEGLKIYGLAPHENPQSLNRWYSFVHPDDLDYVTKLTRDAQTTFEKTAFFHRIIRKDGTIRHMYAQSQFEFSSDGTPAGVYGIALDVTDIKEAENALQQSQANLSLIMDLIPQSIFIKDDTGRFAFANKAFAKMTGKNKRDLINTTMQDSLHRNNKVEYLLNQDQRVIESGHPIVLPEHKFTDYNGRERIMHITKVPFTIPGTNEMAVLGIGTEITDQKKAEEEKAKMTADIVQRNKDLEQFSYMVSHNLRSPVANIIGLLQLMQAADNSPEDDATILTGLTTSVDKLDRVIRDLNYILQVKQNINEKKETLTFSDLIRDIKESINTALTDADIQINCNFSKADEIHTIKSYLYSILFNLISNSIKYRRPHVQPVIKIESSIEEGQINIRFQDNGLGIDLAKHDGQIFGLYKRFHHHTEGKGVGLYMVKTQVEALGGKISVESEINSGTIFNIKFETGIKSY